VSLGGPHASNASVPTMIATSLGLDAGEITHIYESRGEGPVVQLMPHPSL
jgi:hypothetical protein